MEIEDWMFKPMKAGTVYCGGDLPEWIEALIRSGGFDPEQVARFEFTGETREGYPEATVVLRQPAENVKITVTKGLVADA